MTRKPSMRENLVFYLRSSRKSLRQPPRLGKVNNLDLTEPNRTMLWSDFLKFLFRRFKWLKQKF